MKHFRAAAKYGSQLRSKVAAVGLAASLVAAGAHAQAVNIDTTGLIARVTSGEATMTDIGMMGLLMLALVTLFKYIRRVF